MPFSHRLNTLNREDQWEILRIYDRYFSYKIRLTFSDWIDSDCWLNLDLNKFSDRDLANNLAIDLINKIKFRASFDPKFVPISEQVMEKYSSQPLLLFDSVKQCRMAEEAFFKMASENINETDFTEINQIEQSLNTSHYTDNYCKKIEDINKTFNLKMKFQRIEKYKNYLIENNLDVSGVQPYQSECIKYINEHGQFINQLSPFKDIAFQLLRQWKSYQKDSIIEGSHIIEKISLDKIQDLISALISSVNNSKEMLILFRKSILFNNHELESMTEEMGSKSDKLMMDLICNELLVIEEQPNMASLSSHGIVSSQNWQQVVHNKQCQPLVIITKNKFRAKVRLLLTKNIIDNYMVSHSKVGARLLSAHEVDCLNKIGIDSFNSNNRLRQIKNGDQDFSYDNEKKELSVYFDGMELYLKRDRSLTTLCVSEEKFALLFVTEINIMNTRLTLYSLSLPIVILSRYNSEALGTILWDIRFSKPNRIPFEVPDKVCWSQLAQLLSDKFKSETGLGLSDDHLMFIRSIIPKIQDQLIHNQDMICWKQFSKTKLWNRNFTFWQWFYEVMVLTRDFLALPWQEGLIYGFISSQRAQNILSNSCDGTFLLRFSESVLGGITISFMDNKRFKKYIPYNTNHLKTLSLPNLIQHFEKIKYLYPNIPKNEAFGSHYKNTTDIIKTFSVSGLPYTNTEITMKENEINSQVQPNFANQTNNPINYPDQQLDLINSTATLFGHWDGNNADFESTLFQS